MTNMSPNEFLKAVDHAAGMNDRWLFLAAFCLLLLGGGIVIYWLVRLSESGRTSWWRPWLWLRW